MVMYSRRRKKKLYITEIFRNVKETINDMYMHCLKYELQLGRHLLCRSTVVVVLFPLPKSFFLQFAIFMNYS